jgi:hypothetical protein
MSSQVSQLTLNHPNSKGVQLDGFSQDEEIVNFPIYHKNHEGFAKPPVHP